MFIRANIIKSLIVACMLIILSCSGGNMAGISGQEILAGISDDALDSLSKKNIYFGHHSVGNNIIQGIKDLMAEDKRLKLNIIQPNQIENNMKGLFIHSKVGENTKPKTKIDAFYHTMEDGGVTNSVNYSFFKFCYVDIGSDTNVNKLLAQYKETMGELQKKYTDVQFIHFTVPLKSVHVPLKAKIKNFIKRRKGSQDSVNNVKRNEYNDLLRAELQSDMIFDIAEYQSTFGKGKRITYEMDGKRYYAMAKEYTYDGGHLNEFGRKNIAAKLISFLSKNL